MRHCGMGQFVCWHLLGKRGKYLLFKLCFMFMFVVKWTVCHSPSCRLVTARVGWMGGGGKKGVAVVELYQVMPVGVLYALHLQVFCVAAIHQNKRLCFTQACHPVPLFHARHIIVVLRSNPFLCRSGPKWPYVILIKTNNCQLWYHYLPLHELLSVVSQYQTVRINLISGFPQTVSTRLEAWCCPECHVMLKY